MRIFVLAIFAISIVVVAWGCPQTQTSSQPKTDKLLDKFKEEGKKVTILYFGLGSADRKVIRLREFLKSIAENLSDGTVKFKAVDSRADRESKEAYAILTYPTILFFNEEGTLVERRGPDLTPDEAKKIVKENHGTVQSVEGEEEEPEEVQPPPVKMPEKAPEKAPEEGKSGGDD